MSFARLSILSQEQSPLIDPEDDIKVTQPLMPRTVSSLPWWRKLIDVLIVVALTAWLVASVIHKRDDFFANVDVKAMEKKCFAGCTGDEERQLLKVDIAAVAYTRYINQDHLATRCELLVDSFKDFKACKAARDIYTELVQCKASCHRASMSEAESKTATKYIFIMVGMIVLGVAWSKLSEHTGIGRWLHRAFGGISVPASIGTFGLPIIALVLFIFALTLRIAKDTSRTNVQTVLQPVLGLAVIPAVWYVMSANRKAIAWRTVLGGFSLEVLFALSMQFGPSKMFVKTLGDLVTGFLEFSLKGSEFVFGAELIKISIFAFKVMPTIIFFSAFVSVAYYVGLLQVCILGVAKFLRILIGASTIEAVSSSGNIFLGIAEVPLLLKPLLPLAKKGELHVIMTCGYASVAGSVLAGYIGMGIQADYLVLSCLMSAPAAVAMSKLAYPDEEEAEEEKLEDGAEGVADAEDAARDALKTNDGSIVEAAGNGASNAIGLVANIIAMLVAFLGLINALNVLTQWFFGCLGWEGISVSKILGILLCPAAFMLGVPPSECRAVGLLLAQKLVLNEFVAYGDLGVLIKNRKGMGLEQPQGYNIIQISAQGEVTATFALCGFANLGSVGMMLGGLAVVCPERRADFAPMVLRTMLVGFSVSLVNSCVATMLIDPKSHA